MAREINAELLDTKIEKAQKDLVTTVIRWFDNSAKKWNRNALFDAVWNSDSMKISNAASEKTIGCYSTEWTEL